MFILKRIPAFQMTEPVLTNHCNRDFCGCIVCLCLVNVNGM